MRLWSTAVVLALAGAALAQTDHDNLDAGRPLAFDDAEPVALGALGVEFGLSLERLRSKRWFTRAPIGIVYGAALNTQVELEGGIDFGSRRSGGSSMAVGPASVGVLYGLRRETRQGPALAVKAEYESPEDGSGGSIHLRGIATRAARQYDRVHLNLDVAAPIRPAAGKRPMRLGAVLGYSTPVGYPTHFDTTAVAELSLRQGEERGDPLVSGVGIGVRRQVSPTSVLDLGVQSELSGRDRVPLRLIVGYSISF